jgi:hypothetical protein
MKFIKIHKYILCIFACLVVYKNVRRVFVFARERFAPRSISITCKNIYSDELRDEIKQCAIKYLSGRSYADVSLAELHKNLKQCFKLIKKISWNWGSWGESELVIEGVRPLFLVNDMFVLGDKRRLFPTVFFTDISLDKLHPVSLDFSLCGIKVPRRVHSFLQKIPKDYWESYKVFYISRERIELEEKKSKTPVCFVLNEEMLFDRKKMKKAEYLSVARPVDMKRKYVAYDLRFTNRIYAKIIGRRKGG